MRVYCSAIDPLCINCQHESALQSRSGGGLAVQEGPFQTLLSDHPAVDLGLQEHLVDLVAYHHLACNVGVGLGFYGLSLTELSQP